MCSRQLVGPVCTNCACGMLQLPCFGRSVNTITFAKPLTVVQGPVVRAPCVYLECTPATFWFPHPPVCGVFSTPDISRPAALPALQLVVVSPLRRTLETAAGVFGAKAPPATAAAATAASAWTLMQQQAGRPAETTPQPMLYLPPVQRRAAIAAAGASAAGAALDAAVSVGAAFGGAGGVDSRGDDHQPLRLLANEACRERIGVCASARIVAFFKPMFGPVLG
jgi:hypothetical protein